MNVLPPKVKAARDRAAKQRRIKMLCARLDRLVAQKEKLKSGKTRQMWHTKAEKTRKQLRLVEEPHDTLDWVVPSPKAPRTQTRFSPVKRAA